MLFLFPGKLVALLLRNIPAEIVPPDTLLTLAVPPSVSLTCSLQWAVWNWDWRKVLLRPCSGASVTGRPCGVADHLLLQMYKITGEATKPPVSKVKPLQAGVQNTAKLSVKSPYLALKSLCCSEVHPYHWWFGATLIFSAELMMHHAGARGSEFPQSCTSPHPLLWVLYWYAMVDLIIFSFQFVPV